jgi:transposase InsO family protein
MSVLIKIPCAACQAGK